MIRKCEYRMRLGPVIEREFEVRCRLRLTAVEIDFLRELGRGDRRGGVNRGVLYCVRHWMKFVAVR